MIIFDEAHNLESVASEAASFELTSAQVAGAQEEALKCHKLFAEGGIDEVTKRGTNRPFWTSGHGSCLHTQA